MPSLHLPEEMAGVARELIGSYEARVSSVEQIIEATHETLEAFRSQREAIRAQLRETLARAVSLRRRDFDAMMQGLLARQEEHEGAVKETIKDYLAEQRALAAALKDALAGAEAVGIETAKELLQNIAARREAREREVRALLAEYQREQEELTLALRGFLLNGGSMSAREFKATLRTLEARRGEGRRDGGDHMRVLSRGGVRSL